MAETRCGMLLPFSMFERKLLLRRQAAELVLKFN